MEPNAHYRLNKSPQIDSVLSQASLVHTTDLRLILTLISPELGLGRQSGRLTSSSPTTVDFIVSSDHFILSYIVLVTEKTQ
jgi:hypothetical protein